MVAMMSFYAEKCCCLASYYNTTSTKCTYVCARLCSCSFLAVPNGTLILVYILYRDLLREVVQMLHSTANPQVEYIVRTMKKWAKDNHIAIM